MKDHSNYFNRDISWLSFNERVLLEAADEEVPLYERIKFLAIYASNLDEFYSVRMANLKRLAAINKKKINKELNIEPKKLLLEINDFISQQLSGFGTILREDIIPKLAEEGVVVYQSEKKVYKHHLEEIRTYFRSYVMGLIRPVVFSEKRCKPFLDSGQVYLALTLKEKSTEVITYGYLNIPRARLGRFLSLKPYRGKHYFIFIDDVIRLHLSDLLPTYEILECKSIKLEKDADLMIDNEYSGDLLIKIGKQINKRNLGSSARFLYDGTLSEQLMKQLLSGFSIGEEDLVSGGRYHGSGDYFQLPNPIGKHLENEPLPPIIHKSLSEASSFFSAIDEQDRMLHFPYHDYAHVLQFFNEAALDPCVTSIKVIFYRMASNSFIGEALITAAKNGKNVTVFMELKARFDEANNIKWSERMKEAGIHVVYSIPGIKVHAKAALVRRKFEGKSTLYGFFGTGNLNEKTSKIYADHAMFSSNSELTSELNRVFKFLTNRKEPKPFKHLLVSQFNIVPGIIALIDKEIEAAKMGISSGIILKANNLEDKEIIDKLYEASQAGVRIELIIRGICCLIPQKPGLSDNITVIRIVDRFLEHARVFIFHSGGEERIFMGSADLMKRNLRKRIEVVFPVLDQTLKEEIKKIIKFQLEDNTKATKLDQRLNNRKVVPEGKKLVRAQLATYNYLS